MLKVYGPYTRPDGRKHVIWYDGMTRRTQSYPRYLMEQHLERFLEDWEEVDHINDDHTDDRIKNLQLLTRSKNASKSTKPAEVYGFACPQCGTWTQKPASKVRHNRKQGKSGPYCSKSCAGMAKSGKRSGLKSRRTKVLVGSSPTTRTTN